MYIAEDFDALLDDISGGFGNLPEAIQCKSDKHKRILMCITIENMEVYKATARCRKENEKKLLSERYHKAWEIAREGSELMKKEFKAKEVIIFGSLVRKELFHVKSDVDLAIRGLDKKLYYRAVSMLLDLNADIQIDLVMIEDASESLRKYIEKEGIVI